MLPRGEERLQEAFSALLKMRRDLAGQGSHFAVFDSVCIGYLHHTGKLTQEKIKALFPAEELDLLTKLVEEIPGIGIIQSLFSILNKMALDEAPQCVVLFFDTPEAFWGPKERDLAGDLFFVHDEWLRRLLGTLEFSSGIVAIVAGRERPRWAKAPKTKGQIEDKFSRAYSSNPRLHA